MSRAGKGFFRRQEVQDLIALSRAIADRRDTLAFGALLRGPLVGLSEEEVADAIAALTARGPGRGFICGPIAARSPTPFSGAPDKAKLRRQGL
jgi:superfamily I DNA/RNA helicase